MNVRIAILCRLSRYPLLLLYLPESENHVEWLLHEHHPEVLWQLADLKAHSLAPHDPDRWCHHWPQLPVSLGHLGWMTSDLQSAGWPLRPSWLWCSMPWAGCSCSPSGDWGGLESSWLESNWVDSILVALTLHDLTHRHLLPPPPPLVPTGPCQAGRCQSGSWGMNLENGTMSLSTSGELSSPWQPVWTSSSAAWRSSAWTWTKSISRYLKVYNEKTFIIVMTLMLKYN